MKRRSPPSPWSWLESSGGDSRASGIRPPASTAGTELAPRAFGDAAKTPVSAERVRLSVRRDQTCPTSRSRRSPSSSWSSCAGGRPIVGTASTVRSFSAWDGPPSCRFWSPAVGWPTPIACGLASTYLPSPRRFCGHGRTARGEDHRGVIPDVWRDHGSQWRPAHALGNRTPQRPVTARKAAHGPNAESPVDPRHRAMFCEGFRPATANPPPT